MESISYVGSMNLKRGTPYLYAIIVDCFLYIGITEKIPTIRWGSHFSRSGSFIKSLDLIDSEAAQNNYLKANFYCWELSRVSRVSDKLSITKNIQFIEDKVHLLAICDREVGPKYCIISNTTRTAPLRSSYKYAQTDAEEILQDLKRQI